MVGEDILGMLKIRFLRVGKKNAPIFRLVVADKDAPPRGRFLEILGFYNPYTKERNVKKERIQHWLSNGAQASDTAHNFLIKTGVITGEKIAVHAVSKKAPEKAEAAAPTAPRAEAPAAKNEVPVETSEIKEETLAEGTKPEPATEPEASPATE